MGAVSDLGICALCYITNCFGVVRLCSCGFDLQGVCLTWVYVHCAISDSVALGVTRGMSDLGICALCYIGNCFGVVGLCRFGFRLMGVMSDLGIYALCYITNCFGVVGLCSSGFNSWGVCLTWVYVHCAISETALV